MKIYVAASWKTPRQPEVVQLLRDAGQDVYDFRGEEGFHWSSVLGPEYEYTDPDIFRTALKTHPECERGFKRDMYALDECDLCILVLPCGRSAHLELGFAAGMRKYTAILLEDGEKPDLMYKMIWRLWIGYDEMLSGVLSLEDKMKA